MSLSDHVKVFCKYCGKELEWDVCYLAPQCDCKMALDAEKADNAKYEETRLKNLEEEKEAPEFKVLFDEKREVQDKDGSHFIRIEAIEYPDGVGFCVWYPSEEYPDSGVCFDFTDEDAVHIFEMLKKYFEQSKDQSEAF